MIAFLGFVQALVAIVVLAFFCTQVFLPIWRGTPLFPMLLRESFLRGRLGRARQERLEGEIQKEIQDIQKGVAKNDRKSG